MSTSRSLHTPINHLLVLLLIIAFNCEPVFSLPTSRPGASTEPPYHKQGRRRNPPAPRTAQDFAPVDLSLEDFKSAYASGSYELAFYRLGNTAGILYTANNFPAAMQAYKIFANFADPFTTIDPSDEKEEAIRKSTVLKDVSRNYVKFMINTYQVRKELCQANNCLDLGWEMTEKIKSRLLRIDLINSAMSRLGQSQRQEVGSLMTRVKQERFARNGLRMATGNLLSPTGKDGTIAAIDSEIAKYLPEYTALASEITPMQRVRETLADNETLLSFVYANNDRSVYVWKLEKNAPPNQPPVIKTTMLTEPLFSAIEWLKEAMVSGYSLEDGDIPKVLNMIYSDLIKPLNLSPGRRLIIAVDQNLSGLPFDVLPMADGRRMMDSFDITYVPSANVFYHLRQQHRAQNNRELPYQLDYAGFGYAGSEGDELIHTETEIENAARNFPRNVKEPNATEAEIYSHAPEIANARYLHFATHNYLVKGVDASFFLAFGKDEGGNGRLTSQEIVTRLHNRAELTVLSSCETAPAKDNYFMGQITPMDPQNDGGRYRAAAISYCICSYGESFSNLTGAFFASGSKRLLLTQWRIRDDAVTDVFISKFFRLLADGRPPAAALKDVKRAMSAQKPVSWAGFILAGD